MQHHAPTSSPPSPPYGDNYGGNATTNYLSVNIVSGSETNATKSTRVNEENTPTFQKGGINENKVSSVRFYFFDKDGNAAKVKSANDTKVNYYDWPKNPATSEPENNEDNNIEKIVTAQLVINTAEGDEVPASIVAVINPTEELKSSTITSLNGNKATALNNVTGNYAIVKDADNPYGSFVMSNSVYADANNNKMEAVEIGTHMYTNEAAALADPVTIYVERVNAKAQVTCALEKVTNITTKDGVQLDNVYKTNKQTNYSTEKFDEGDTELENIDVYVQFLGWNVTCTTKKSNLMKDIKPTWTDNDVFGEGTVLKWNIPSRFRSFWAINPTLENNDYEFGDFEQAQLIKGFTSPNEEEAPINFTYMQENAPSFVEGKHVSPTKLIVAGQLIDKNGEPLTLCQYGFFQYTYEGLQKKIASMCEIYTKTTNNNDETITISKIPFDKIKFVTASSINKANPTTNGRYYSFAHLATEDADDQTTEYYIGKTSNNPATVKEVNDELERMGHVKIWEKGYTYWYADIQHLGLDGSLGAVGVIRNHIYAINITDLTGLGTPVFDDIETIYPEKPTDDDTYIGAEIKVLTWRLVNQDVSFAW